MKKILVVDTAAETGGALSILNDFYSSVVDDNNEEIMWYFVVSKVQLESVNNVKALQYEWTKKSKIHRLLFDYIWIPHIIKKYKIDVVFSLQNLTAHTKKPQMIYLHQSIPFFDYKFSLLNDRNLWFIQNIMKIFICHSIKKAKKVIVQSEWMRKACIQSTKVNSEKILVLPPEVHGLGISKYKYSNKPINKFFYPAIAREYKNHEVIIKACILLKQWGVTDFEVFFTFNKNDNSYATRLFQETKENNLKINFLGRITKDEVYKYYAESVLIFPSYIETVGLPLKEAKKAEDIILVSNCAYARESLGDYVNAYYFDFNDAEILATYMRKCIENKMIYHSYEVCDDKIPTWEKAIDEICNL